MSDAMVPRALRSDDAYGRLTHVERINPGDNPADGWVFPRRSRGEPDPMTPAHRGPKRRYRLLTSGVHNSILCVAGSIVELYADEVGPHHELLPESEAASDEAADDAALPAEDER